jgi:hypothetical protein
LQKSLRGIGPAYFSGAGTTVRGKIDVNSPPFFLSDVWHIGYDCTAGIESRRNQIRALVKDHIQGPM